MTTSSSESSVEQQINEIKQLSSFILDDDITTVKFLENILQKVLSDLDIGFDSDEENVRVLNFISYLYWRKGDRTKAEDYADRAETYETKSIVSLHNRIIFHWETNETFQFMELMEISNKDNQKDKETFERRKAFAIAEIAYCFARIGPKCHEKAEHYFRKAIEYQKRAKIKHYLWEFGLALILRRQANIFAMRNPNQFNPSAKNQEAIDLLERITIMSTDRQIWARAWVELGIIMWSKDCSSTCENLRCTGFSVEECFNNALKLCPDAYFVLQRWGQHLRYLKKYYESKKILEKSLHILDTPFARHHIALTLRMMVLRNDQTFDSGKDTRKHEISHPFNPHEIASKNLQIPNRSQHGLKNAIVSPKKVSYYPQNSKLNEAVDHLKKALELNENFDKARYDLGLTYRYLKRHKEAIDCFSKITSARWGRSSEYKVLIIYAYEQQGICHLEMAEMENDEKKKAKSKTNGESLLRKSLEVATLVIKTIPSIKEASASFPTLKELLSTKDGNQHSQNYAYNCKELAKVYELVHDHDKAADLYKQLLEIDDTDSFAIRKVVENYVRLEDFENAIQTLALLQCTRQSNLVERKLYLSTYLDGAKHSYEKGNTDEAKLRFMQAYNLVSKDCVGMCNTECTCCEILLLCVAHIDEYCSCKLSNFLVTSLSSQLGVRVSINDADCLAGHLTRTYMHTTMENAKYIMPIVNKSPVCNRQKSNLGCFVEDEILLHKNKLIAITFENTDDSFARSVLVKGETCENFDMTVLKVADLISDIVMEMSQMSN